MHALLEKAGRIISGASKAAADQLPPTAGDLRGFTYITDLPYARTYHRYISNPPSEEVLNSQLPHLIQSLGKVHFGEDSDRGEYKSPNACLTIPGKTGREIHSRLAAMSETLEHLKNSLAHQWQQVRGLDGKNYLELPLSIFFADQTKAYLASPNNYASLPRDFFAAHLKLDDSFHIQEKYIRAHCRPINVDKYLHALELSRTMDPWKAAHQAGINAAEFMVVVKKALLPDHANLPIVSRDKNQAPIARLSSEENRMFKEELREILAHTKANSDTGYSTRPVSLQFVELHHRRENYLNGDAFIRLEDSAANREFLSAQFNVADFDRMPVVDETLAAEISNGEIAARQAAVGALSECLNKGVAWLDHGGKQHLHFLDINEARQANLALRRIFPELEPAQKDVDKWVEGPRIPIYGFTINLEILGAMEETRFLHAEGHDLSAPFVSDVAERLKELSAQHLQMA